MYTKSEPRVAEGDLAHPGSDGLSGEFVGIWGATAAAPDPHAYRIISCGVPIAEATVKSQCGIRGQSRGRRTQQQSG